MRRRRAATWLVLVGALICPFRAGRSLAQPRPAPLRTFEPDKLRGLEPLLRDADLSLIERSAQGRMVQITSLALVAAPVDVVRGVVAQPERYGEFIRNMEESSVSKRTGATLDHSYSIAYSLAHVHGRHRFVLLPAEPGGGAPPIDIYDPDDNGVRHYRWEFLPVPTGTVLVLYGYTNMPDDGIVKRLTSRIPSLEYGFALITQMTQLLAMKKRAEQLAGPRPPPPGAAAQVSYQFMLERGVVVLTRTQGGRLSTLSLIDQSRARPEALLQVAGSPGAWSQFIPSISRSIEGSAGGTRTVELEQSLPLMSWRTQYGVVVSGATVDMLGVSGDLRGARIRWDVRPSGNGASLLVLRTNQELDRSSMVIRQLYKLEPLFEYGINVGLNLLLLWGVKWRAEQVTAR